MNLLTLFIFNINYKQKIQVLNIRALEEKKKNSVCEIQAKFSSWVNPT
jgi:hypothetical protein